MKTNVALVVDASGSMHPFRQSVIKQFTKQHDDIPRGNPVHIVMFDDRVSVVDNLDNYTCDGLTALYDAVTKAITLVDDGKTPALVIILTDGHENASKVKADELSARIRKLQATDRFTFAFMVPPGYADFMVRQLGVPAGNVTEWEGTQKAFDAVTHTTQVATVSYFTARAAGKTSVDTFYSNADGVTSSDINKLGVVRGVKIYEVPREVDIRDFVESKGHTYVPGNAAYQLTKPEIVQENKALFITEKGKKTVRSGDVRGLLGLPTGKIKVIPGNHANYDIFVQSRSVNRKLVRGTRLLYTTN